MNPLLKYGGIVLMFVIFIGLMRACSSSSVNEVSVEGPDPGKSHTGQLATTQAEELRTVSAKLSSVESTATGLQGEVVKLKQDLEQRNQAYQEVQENVAEVKDELDKARNENLSRWEERSESEPDIDMESVRLEIQKVVSETLQASKDKLNGKARVFQGDGSVNNPLSSDGSDDDVDYSIENENPFVAQEYVWVAPIDEPDLVQNGRIAWGQLKEQLASVAGTVGDSADTISQTLDNHTLIPMFTLPANTTLLGGKTTGRLLARIAKSGSVENPYGFKVIVPGRSLMANGHSLEDVSHAFMGGYAVGDLGMLCARAYITNMTLIFDDGRIAQIGEPNVYGEAAKNAEVLGVLAGTSGLECVRGVLKSNLKEFVTTHSILGALEAAGQGAVAGQTTTVVDGGSSSSAPTGSVGAIIGGNALAGATGGAKSWVEERWDQTFDAILVEIGTDVMIEIKREIEIDYDPQARKVRYRTQEELSGLLYGREMAW